MSLLLNEIGTNFWWETVGSKSPLLQFNTSENNVRATFYWRDPFGSEQDSPYKRVIININGLINHHDKDPASFERITGTDVWYFEIELPASWSGSYHFIPLQEEQLPEKQTWYFSGDKVAQRQWLIKLLKQSAIADPLHKKTNFITSMAPKSCLILPGANQHKIWQQSGKKGGNKPQCQTWVSTLLKNERRVWVYESGSKNGNLAERPLIILLDGQYWADTFPLCSVVDSQTDQHLWPEAVYVFIDSLDGDTRSQELPCNKDFWLAVQSELLPQIAGNFPFTSDADKTIVAGQSFGGLSAMFAALHWPDKFGKVLCQSGSFWWPHVGELKAAEKHLSSHEKKIDGWLTSELTSGNLTFDKSLTVFQEVGQYEQDMVGFNKAMHQALVETGHSVSFRIFNGGHDWLCWREGLVDGLNYLFSER